MFQLFAISTGTSIVLAGTINKAISILFGFYVFGTVLSGTQVVVSLHESASRASTNLMCCFSIATGRVSVSALLADFCTP
jgi:hypothetical protein